MFNNIILRLNVPYNVVYKTQAEDDIKVSSYQVALVKIITKIKSKAPKKTQT